MKYFGVKYHSGHFEGIICIYNEALPYLMHFTSVMSRPVGNLMLKKNTPPSYGVPAGPIMVAFHANKSSPTQPTVIPSGGSRAVFMTPHCLKGKTEVGFASHTYFIKLLYDSLERHAEGGRNR
jgi:hypothetical protein